LKFILQFVPWVNNPGDKASTPVYHNLFTATSYITESYTIYWYDVGTSANVSEHNSDIMFSPPSSYNKLTLHIHLHVIRGFHGDEDAYCDLLDMISCSPKGWYQRFGGTHCLSVPGST
jgi:hypothetical protein